MLNMMQPYQALIANLLLMTSNVVAFGLGVYINWKHKTAQSSADIIGGLTADNKGYQQLVNSTKAKDDQQQIQINHLSTEILQLQGRLKMYEIILENRNPDLEKDLAEIKAYISKVRDVSNSPVTQ